MWAFQGLNQHLYLEIPVIHIQPIKLRIPNPGSEEVNALPGKLKR